MGTQLQTLKTLGTEAQFNESNNPVRRFAVLKRNPLTCTEAVQATSADGRELEDVVTDYRKKKKRKKQKENVPERFLIVPSEIEVSRVEDETFRERARKTYNRQYLDPFGATRQV